MNDRRSLVLALGLFACAGDSADTDASTTTSATTSGGSESTDPTAVSMTATTTTDGPTTTDGTSSTSVADTSTGDSTMDPDSSSSTTEPVAFALTSTAFVEGGGIPGIHHSGGGNQSPPLEWVGAPAGAMSFAVFFHDNTIDYDHSAIWNIDAELDGLPQDVDHDAMPADVPGAVQCRSWLGAYGYGGPGSAANVYEFTLYAIDVAELPEVDSESSLGEVRAAFEAHSLGTATLAGHSTGPG